MTYFSLYGAMLSDFTFGTHLADHDNEPHTLLSERDHDEYPFDRTDQHTLGFSDDIAR